MNITKELRRFANSGMSAMECAAYSDKLIAIADHIDMEHERRMVERADRYSELRTSLKERYIELPKDADDVPIHVGDEVKDVDYDGHASVFDMHIATDGWWVCAGGVCRRPDSYRHYHAPTVEDVLLEFGEWYTHTKGGCDEDNIIAEYAAKLRLAEEDA